MSRRIEIELTSQRPDGSWTWRAAGAREPKGELAGDLITFAASVGDELTVEAEFHMDGIEIIEAFEPKTKRPMPETLEVLGSGRDQPLVTTQLVANRKGRDRDGGRGDRRGRQDRRSRGDRQNRDRRESRSEEDRPKAKRLRPGRAHRQALIDGLSDEQKPVAEKMIRDGISSVEQALRDQRKKARDAAQARKKAAQEAAKASKDTAEDAAKPEEPAAEDAAKPEEPTAEDAAKPEEPAAEDAAKPEEPAAEDAAKPEEPEAAAEEAAPEDAAKPEEPAR